MISRTSSDVSGFEIKPIRGVVVGRTVSGLQLIMMVS